MNKSDIDRLGERLRATVTPEDLTLLDAYRRSFRQAYDTVVDRIRLETGLEASGRPAKSTSAIVDKLRRGSMRFTQMQDIAGCRIIVPDTITQACLTATLEQMFSVSIIDRRAKPSHGYRAVHVVVRDEKFPVEVQVRTDLQHTWAELSEKLADNFGIELKYGGGPPVVRKLLDELSEITAEFEDHLDIDSGKNERIDTLKRRIRNAMKNMSTALKRTS
jgi:ppGpp synthetase/RelA/SpoT-type nucleotidyltranferase